MSGESSGLEMYFSGTLNLVEGDKYCHRSKHIRSGFVYICITRCKLTTVDHKRGEFTGPEPLETLGKYNHEFHNYGVQMALPH